jgi:hypothetical protein
MVSIGDITSRLRTDMAPIRPGCSRFGKVLTGQSGRVTAERPLIARFSRKYVS